MKIQHRKGTIKALMLSVALTASPLGGGCAPAGHDEGAGEWPALELDASAGTSAAAVKRGAPSGRRHADENAARLGGCRGPHCGDAFEAAPPRHDPGCTCSLCVMHQAAGPGRGEGPSSAAPATPPARGAGTHDDARTGAAEGGASSSEGRFDGNATHLGECAGTRCTGASLKEADGQHPDGCMCEGCLRPVQVHDLR